MNPPHEPDAARDAARGREHPTARFAARAHEFDLRAVAAELAAEAPARRGQRTGAGTFASGTGFPGRGWWNCRATRWAGIHLSRRQQ